MVYKNLNLPATLIHTVKGKKYTLEGQILSINESLNTCTMDFNGKVNNNIPLEEVYLNENVVDALKKIKAGAKKVWLKAIGIVKKIGNFLLPVTDNGEKLVQFINNPVNIACMNLSPAVSVCPSDATQEVCEMFGLDCKGVSEDQAFADLEDNEVNDANKIWTKIIKTYANSDLSLTETLQSIDKSFWNSLNEAIPTLNSPIFSENDDAIEDANGDGGIDLYGIRLTASELKTEIRDNLYNQLTNKDENVKPLLIWGAPGIGKSAIIKGAAKMLKNEYNFDLDMITINCGALRPDDWELPNNAKDKFGNDTTISVPKSWMPIYCPGAYEPEQLPAVEKYYRSGEFRKIAYQSSNMGRQYIDDRDTYDGTDGKAVKRPEVGFESYDKDDKSYHDGGIIFFDEVGRCATKDITFTMMSLLGDHRYGQDFILAPGWCTIGASNRLHDDGLKHDDKEFFSKWPMAVSDRWVSVTYAPTKAEWLDWARQPNKEGKRNVDIAIIDFITQMEDLVWYYCIDFIYNGNSGKASEYKKLKANFQTIAKNLHAGTAFNDSDTTNFDSYYGGKGSRKFGNYTGRTWHEKISIQYIGALKQLFANQPELLDNCYISTTDVTTNDAGDAVEYEVRELDYNKLADALNQIPSQVWYKWARPKKSAMVRNGISFVGADENIIDTNRIRFYKKYLQFVIAENTGSRSVPTQAYSKYMDMHTFTSRTIESVWKKGYASYIGAPAWIDNILEKQGQVSKYINDNENIAWKANPGDIDKIIQMVSRRVENINTQTVRKEYNNILDICKKEGIDIKNPIISIDDATVKEWLDKYTIKFVNRNNVDIKSVCAFLPTKSYSSLNKDEKQEIQRAIFVLMHSKTAQQLANFAMWVGKICVQEHQSIITAQIAEQSNPASAAAIFLHEVCKDDKSIGSYHARSLSLSIIGPFSIITKALSEYDLNDF